MFLTASRDERARRRYKQLSEKGIDANLQHILGELAARDARDSERSVSPLRPADDAVIIDTTAIGIDGVVAQVLSLWQEASQKAD